MRPLLHVARIYGWLGVLSFAALGFVSAQASVLAPAEVAFPILATGTGARGTALGDAFTAAVEDASALFWNPAGLARLRGVEVQTGYHRLPVDGYEESVLGGIPVGSLGVLGWGAELRDYGSQDGYDSQGISTGTFHPQDLSLGLGWGAVLQEKWRLGFSSFWFKQDAPGSSLSGMAGNLGLLLGPWSGLRVGTSLRNMGVESEGSPLPFSWDLGVCREIRWSQDRHRLLTAVGIQLRKGGDNKANLGLEYGYHGRVFVRAGWAPRWTDNAMGRIQGFSTGAGVSLEDWSFDYSLASQADLGWEHRLSLTWHWNRRGGRAALGPGKGNDGRPVGGPSASVPVWGPAANSAPITMIQSSAPPIDGTSVAPPLPAPLAGPAPADGKALVLTFHAEEGNASWGAEDFFQAGERAVRESRWEDALRLFRLCVEKNPTKKEAWERISQLEYRSAMEARRKAQELGGSPPASGKGSEPH